MNSIYGASLCCISNLSCSHMIRGNALFQRCRCVKLFVHWYPMPGRYVPTLGSSNCVSLRSMRLNNYLQMYYCLNQDYVAKKRPQFPDPCSFYPGDNFGYFGYVFSQSPKNALKLLSRLFCNPFLFCNWQQYWHRKEVLERSVFRDIIHFRDNTIPVTQRVY